MKTIIKANVVEAMTVPFTISVAATDEGLAYEYLGSVMPLIEADLKRVDARFSPFKDDYLAVPTGKTVSKWPNKISGSLGAVSFRSATRTGLAVVDCSRTAVRPCWSRSLQPG